jgi:hypothetical protein
LNAGVWGRHHHAAAATAATAATPRASSFPEGLREAKRPLECHTPGFGCTKRALTMKRRGALPM